MCGVGQRRFLVGGRLVACLLLLECDPFGAQPVLVDMKGINGKGDVAACDVLVLLCCQRFALVHLEQAWVSVDLRARVDVGRHCFSLEPFTIATHPSTIGLEPVLTRTDLRLVLLDLGGVDVVLLLVRADLELLEYEVLGDLGRLRFEVRHLVGRRGSRRHDHRCSGRGDESQADDPRPYTGEPPYSVSRTWLRRRARSDTGHNCRTFSRSCVDNATRSLAGGSPQRDDADDSVDDSQTSELEKYPCSGRKQAPTSTTSRSHRRARSVTTDEVHENGLHDFESDRKNGDQSPSGSVVCPTSIR